MSEASEVARGVRLEYVTIGYNCLEALVGLVSGAVAGSIALIGFGFDSLIEVTSGAALLWRLRRHEDFARREAAEKTALRIVGGLFFALAAYVVWESADALIRREAPRESVPGIVLAATSLIVMPILARRKRRVGKNLASDAMVADSRQTELCAYLSAILLGGLALNAAFGWWWADPAAGLAMAPIILKEGWSAWRGRGCGCHD
jgi:divalent metal cation (Fe/Co/Zn/Cd) transporter